MAPDQIGAASLLLLHLLQMCHTVSSSALPEQPYPDVWLTGFEPNVIDGQPVEPACKIITIGETIPVASTTPPTTTFTVPSTMTPTVPPTTTPAPPSAAPTLFPAPTVPAPTLPHALATPRPKPAPAPTLPPAPATPRAKPAPAPNLPPVPATPRPKPAPAPTLPPALATPRPKPAPAPTLPPAPASPRLKPAPAPTLPPAPASPRPKPAPAPTLPPARKPAPAARLVTVKKAPPPGPTAPRSVARGWPPPVGSFKPHGGFVLVPFFSADGRVGVYRHGAWHGLVPPGVPLPGNGLHPARASARNLNPPARGAFPNYAIVPANPPPRRTHIPGPFLPAGRWAAFPWRTAAIRTHADTSSDSSSEEYRG